MGKKADETALKTIQKAWQRSHDVQKKRNEIYTRQWQRYKGQNPNVTDPYRSNLVMPTQYAACETVNPRISKALFGKRPYIPIKSEKNPDAVKPIELALDTYLYWANFKILGKQSIKAIFNFGTVFWEPLPVKKMVTERQIVQSPVYPWGPALVDTEVPRFRLDLRLYMPWQVYAEPHMTDLDSPGYVIIVETVPRSEIERLIKAGRYEKVDLDLLKSEGDKQDKQFAEEMFAALNIDRPDEDLDYGVLMRMQTKDEHITAWNGSVVLKDEDNPFDHNKINLVRCAWNLDPMLQNGFWGQPEGKASEGLMDKYDESLNQLFDNAAIANNAVLAYREDAVINPDRLIFVGGAQIPISNNFSGAIKDAVGVLDTRGLPPDAYTIPALLKGEIDRALGVQNPDYAEPTEGSQTATEMSILAEKGDSRNEERTETLEAMALSRLADLCTSHMDQFMGPDDLAEVVGPEMAMQVATMNPHMVPGGFDYQYKGSDSYINDYQARADLRALMEILQNNEFVKQDGLARMACDRYGLNEQETNDIVMSMEEIQMAMQAQQQMMAQEQAQQFEMDTAKSQMESQNRMRENEAKQKPDVKKQKAAQKPTMGNTRGGRA